MKSEKLVSVCVPVYNGAQTIKETLDAVFNQSYLNMEVIVVDNCSTDDTMKILQSYADQRLSIYQNETNLGMVGNWNKCLDYVTGEYIQFVCADDILREDCVEKKVDLIESDDSLSMVFGASQIINETGKLLMERHEFKSDCIVEGKKLAKKAYRLKNLYGEPTNVLFKSKYIPVVGKFAINTCYTTDLDMWIRISCQGKVGYIDEPLIKYRISTMNETSKISYKKLLEDNKEMIRNIYSYSCLDVSPFDVCIRKFMYFSRMIARQCFMCLKRR